MTASLRLLFCTCALLTAGALTDLPGAGPGAARAQVPDDSTYTVKDGDTLYSIARRFGTSVRALRAWNDLESTAIEVGQTLRVRPPSRPNRSPAPADTTRPAPADTTRPPPDSDTTGAPTAPGESPPEAPPADEPPSEERPIERPDAPRGETTGAQRRDTAATAPRPYGRVAVGRGATLVNVALRLGTTADTLLALNDTLAAKGLSTPLEDGRVLRLPRRFGPPTHVVGPDESIYGIAGRYGVSVRALRRANDLDTAAVRPGQRLRLPGRGGAELPPPGALADPDTTGPAALYPSTFAGRLTTSGATYDPDAFVASHPSLPYGSLVLLSTPNGDRHAFARIVDRGPVDADVLIDVSAAVGRQLGIGDEGTAPIALRVAWVAPTE
jgi:LysM repeat protein